MKIRYNFHFHTAHSCDSASMKMADAAKEMTELGMEEFGVTDHLNTPYNISDIISGRHDFWSIKPPENFYFGVEVSSVSRKECELIAQGKYTPWGGEPVYGLRFLEDFGTEFAIGIDEKDVKEIPLDFVIGGVHWPLTNSLDRQTIIRNYLDQQLFLVNHPLVDVLAHPWDSLEMAAANWLKYQDAEHIDRTIFKEVPREYNVELGKALIAQKKLAELNIGVMSPERPDALEFYMDTFILWREMGVKFSVGNDCHSPHFSRELFVARGKMLSDYGFTDEDIVSPIQWKKMRQE